MRFLKRTSLIDRWIEDSSNMASNEDTHRLVRNDGSLIGKQLCYFAEDFFGLTPNDVANLPDDQYTALDNLMRIFARGMTVDSVEAICNIGFGESLSEMFSNSSCDILCPKLVRDYVESEFSGIPIGVAIHFLGNGLFVDAYNASNIPVIGRWHQPISEQGYLKRVEALKADSNNHK